MHRQLRRNRFQRWPYVPAKEMAAVRRSIRVKDHGECPEAVHDVFVREPS
jgi:hypothetical protein